MVDPRAGDVHLRRGGVESGIAEQRVAIAAQRPAAVGGIAAVDQPLVLVIGIGRGETGRLAQFDGHGRREADETALVEIAVAVEFLIGRVDAQRGCIGQGGVDISQQRKGT